MNEYYYVINAMILKDNTPAQSVFAYTNEKEARSVYHQTLASNYASDTIKHFNAIVINSHNLILLSESVDLEG